MTKKSLVANDCPQTMNSTKQLLLTILLLSRDQTLGKAWTHWRIAGQCALKFIEITLKVFRCRSWTFQTTLVYVLWRWLLKLADITPTVRIMRYEWRFSRRKTLKKTHFRLVHRWILGDLALYYRYENEPRFSNSQSIHQALSNEKFWFTTAE